MSKPRKVWPISVLTVVGLLVSGCGGEGSTADATDEQQVLNAMFLGGSGEQGLVDVIRAATEQFNETNEYNVEMRVETYENEQYKTKLASVMAANAQPDVFFTWSSGYLEPFVSGGKVLDMTPYMEADDEWFSRFNEGLFDPVTFDGSIYAVPHGVDIATVFYNEAIFREHDIVPPETYDEFVAIVQKLRAAGVTPLSVASKEAWIPGQLLQQLANVEGGMSLFDETVAQTARWNDERYIAAGEKLKELQELGAFPDGYLGMTNDEGRELFTSGEAAMLYQGSWELAAIGDASIGISADINVFNIPPEKPGERVAVADVGLAFGISSSTKNADAAASYVKLFSTPEVQQAIAYDAGRLISTKTTLDDSKLTPLFVKVNHLNSGLTGITPWFDRVFGAGDGVEFNNIAQAIIAGQDPATKFNELQSFAEANADR